jgi:hypothetical protein
MRLLPLHINIAGIRTMFTLFTQVTVLCLSVISAAAQDTNASGNNWKFLVEPYMMFPNMNGAAGVGILPDVDIDASVDDIFSNLQFGAMLYFEAGNDRWAVTSDVLYMNLKQDVTPGALIVSGELGAKQFAWEVAGLFKVLPWLDGGVGARLNTLSMEMDIVQNEIGGGTVAKNRLLSKTWLDPILIARVKSAPDKKFIYQFRGDLGGFGVGSDFAWQIQAYAGYRFSNLFQMTAGYRYIGIDYNKGTEQERFLYDVDTFGPVLRFGFNF